MRVNFHYFYGFNSGRIMLHEFLRLTSRLRPLLWSSALVALAAALPGCSGDGLGRVPVSGAVTVDGKPVQTGTFSMTPPVEGSGNRPTVHGMISEGRYQLLKAQGPAPGKYFMHVTLYANSSKDDGESAEGSSVKEVGTFSAEITVPENGSDSLDVQLAKNQKSREPV